eukprot:gene10045-7175_t
MSATAAQVLHVLRTQSKSAAKDAVSPYELYEYLHGEADLFGRKASITSVRIKDNVDIQSGGKYRVGWALNDQSASCMRCSAAFSLFNRRHHCRVCGYLICGECSADTVPIDALKPAEAMSRRCKECRLQRRALQSDQPATDAGADADAKHQPRNAEHRVEKAADALKAEEERRRAALEEQKRQRLEAFLAVPDYERSAEYAALSVAERAELTSLAAERKRQEVEGLKTQRQREVERLTLDAADGRTAKQRAEDALAQSKHESAQRLEQDKQQRREAFLAEKGTAVSGRFDEALQRQAEEERRRVEALKSDPRRGVAASADRSEADAAASATDDAPTVDADAVAPAAPTAAADDAMAIAGAQQVDDEDDDGDEDDEAAGGAALQQLGFLGSHSHLVVSEEEVARQLRAEREQEQAAEEQAQQEEALVLDDALLAQDLAAMAGAATRRASHRLSQGRLQTLDAVDAAAPASTDAPPGGGDFFDSPFAGQTPHLARTMSFSRDEAAQRAAELQQAARSLALDLEAAPADAPPAAAAAAADARADDDADADDDAGRASVSSASGAAAGASSKAKGGRKGSRKGRGKGRK